MSEANIALEEKRKAEILAAAQKLFFLHGYSATSVESIAQEAHISKGLIYHYFKDKEDILLSFHDEIISYLKELQEMDNAREALYRFGRDFLADQAEEADMPLLQVFLITFANQYFDISKYPDDNLMERDIGGYLAELFAKAIARKQIPEQDAAKAGEIYWSYLLGKLLLIKKGNDRKPAIYYVKEILSVFEEE